jgi:hypothetical protein
VELADYHSGPQQGHIRILKGKNGVGWASFVEDEEHSDSQLLEFFSNLLFDWATVWGYTNSSSVISFLDSLHLSHT